MEELNALPYPDAVLRENLRINAVVSAVIREADRDDIIPLSTPIVDRKGVARNEVRSVFRSQGLENRALRTCAEASGLRIGKGDSVFVSILAMNRDKTIWGEDAEVFKCVLCHAAIVSRLKR